MPKPLKVKPRLAPERNKFHTGNGEDGKHYWLTPPEIMGPLQQEFNFDFDPCPFPKPEGFDGLTCEWGRSNYVNPPFGSIMHQGKRKGATAWARKAIAENAKGRAVVMVYPIDKWVLMLLAAGAEVRNLGDVRWLATEDGSAGNGTGRHVAAFILQHRPGREARDAEVERRLTGKGRYVDHDLSEWRGECGHVWRKSQSDACPLCAVSQVRAEMDLIEAQIVAVTGPNGGTSEFHKGVASAVRAIRGAFVRGQPKPDPTKADQGQASQEGGKT